MITHLSRLLKVTLAVSLLFSLGACDDKGKGKKGDGAYVGNDQDSVNGTPLADRPDNGISFTSANVDRSQFRPVHFGFDSYVEANEQPELDQIADFMKGGNNTIIIAGFTDERGTEEYNRGLGERRAQAVRAYLIQHGADASKLQTVSFGAEMPADSGSGESAWAKNRRAEFGVVK
jgi:peptidoglycan-associated lipoprotein